MTTKQIDTKANIFYFFILTLIYTIVIQVTGGKGNTVWTGIYIVLVFLTQYYLNIQLSKQLCNGTAQEKHVFFNTFLPWLFIFGSLMALLNAFPGWVRAFSNTLGYSAAKFANVDKVTQSIFKTSNEFDTVNKDNNVLEILEYIYNTILVIIRSL